MSDLASYLASTGTTQRAFAAALGIDQSVVSRIVRGEIRPSLDVAVSIQNITAGAVPVTAWARPVSGAAQ